MEAGRVEAEIGAIHCERGARLSAQLGLDASDAVGHQMEHEGRYVPGCPRASGCCLHGLGELVEGEIVRTADLECLAAGGGVDDRDADDGGDVGDRDDVDRVLPASENQWTAEPTRGPALGRERLIDPGAVLVGTIRRDGTPRISPVEPLLCTVPRFVVGLSATERRSRRRLVLPRVCLHEHGQTSPALSRVL